MKTVYIIISLALFITNTYAQEVPETTGSSVTKADAQQALDLHNKVRADVGTPPLEWSAELSSFAQAWANHLAATNCSFEHRPDQGEWSTSYGENIFMGNGVVYTAKDASDSWYSEIKDYTPGNADFSNTGHYTQMVWRTTTKVGMGVSTCSDGSYIIVANYDPAGNMAGENPY